MKTDYLCLNCNSSKADPILKSAKNHSCTKCSESFRDSYNLKRHIERKHKSVDVPKEDIQSQESEAVVQKEVESCNINEPITAILSSNMDKNTYRILVVKACHVLNEARILKAASDTKCSRIREEQYGRKSYILTQNIKQCRSWFRTRFGLTDFAGNYSHSRKYFKTNWMC